MFTKTLFSLKLFRCFVFANFACLALFDASDVISKSNKKNWEMAWWANYDLKIRLNYEEKKIVEPTHFLMTLQKHVTPSNSNCYSFQDVPLSCFVEVTFCHLRCLKQLFFRWTVYLAKIWFKSKTNTMCPVQLLYKNRGIVL